MKALVALTFLLWATTANADPAGDALASYKAGMQNYLARAQAQLDRERVEFDRKRVEIDLANTPNKVPVAGDRAGARAQPLETDATTSITNLASAAIKTDVADVEAGIQLAPLVLAGRTSLAARGWSVTVAALADSKFRVGTGYRVTLDDIGVGPFDVRLAACQVDLDVQASSLREDASSKAFVAVCERVAAFPEPGPGGAAYDDWLLAMSACGMPAPADLAPDDEDAFAHSQGVDVFAKLTELSQFMDGPFAAASPAFATKDPDGKTAANQLDALRTNRPTRTSCLTNEFVAEAVTKAKWQARDRALGIAVAADFFPIIGGFDVDPATADPNGELSQVSAHAEFRYSSRRVSWGLGLGGTMSREAVADDLAKAATGSAGLSFVVARLDGKPLVDANGAINLENGALPPLLSVGVDLAATVPLSPPATQEKQLGGLAFDKISATAFADFRFTDELAFRIGIPLTAEAATRESDGKRGLVWTVPVFLTTVLKL